MAKPLCYIVSVCRTVRYKYAHFPKEGIAETGE